MARDREAAPSMAGPPVEPRTARSPRWLVLTVWLGFVAGFVVALSALAQPRWFPFLDLAQTEMRVRDVFTSHPPLIGLPGRIGTLGARQGSHPGPLSFWAIAPFYKLFGSSAWAMQAATASLNAIAIGISLMIARRRGGTLVLLGVASALAALTWFNGPSVLTQAWNPYLPMMWFMVFSFGVWSVLCDDLAMLPVATFAGVFCLHTHISYLGLIGGLAALAVAWIGWSAWKRRAELGRRPMRWVLISLGIVTITSIPPIVQQFTHVPGNLTLIWDHFTNPPEDPIGIRAGLDVLFVHLNPWRLLGGQDATTGSSAPGVALLAVWAAGAVLATRRKVRALIALDAVILVSLGLGLLSIANIFGFVWYYLMRWAWGINALMLFTTGWAIVDWMGQRRSTVGTEPSRRRRPVLVVTLLALLTGVYLFGFALDAATVGPPTPRVSSALAVLVDPTVAAIDTGQVPGGGRAGRYQITIKDPISINAPGYGLLSELERSGIHAGFPRIYDAIVRESRVITKRQATAVVHFSVGPDIGVWRAIPGVVQVATVDLRTPSERREFHRLALTLGPRLRAAGRADLVPNLRENVFTASFADGLPPDVQRDLKRMLDIGEPSAVFVGPQSLAE